MSSQREWSADGYVTRRQLREAAHAAQSATSQATPADGTAQSGRTATTPVSATSAGEAAPSAGSALSPVSATSAGEAAPSAAAAPLTRRQLRERERAEEARRSAESAASAEEVAATEVSASAEGHAASATSADEAPAAESGRETGEQTAARAAEDQADTRAQNVRKPPARRWLPRLAVLGALAAVTTVVPLTGAALPTTSSDPITGAPLGETSALQVFSGGGTQLSTDTSAALAADPLASLRSMVATSRSNDRTTTCAAGAMEANGVLASEVEIAPPDIIMPLAEGSFHYTSRYGLRTHPIFGSYSQHTGLDMAAAAGTPIHAAADGTVIHAGAGMDGRSSMLVIIEHEVDGAKFWTWYVHMYPNGVYVSEGQQVTAGEVIGAVGSYGNSTGPHLHFEVHLDQDLTTIDPESWLAQNAVPLDSETLQCTQG